MERMTPTDWETQVKIFEKIGCIFKRQKGSHLIFHYPGAIRPVVIPKHKEISVSIIKANMKTVTMAQEKYFNLAPFGRTFDTDYYRYFFDTDSHRFSRICLKIQN